MLYEPLLGVEERDLTPQDLLPFCPVQITGDNVSPTNLLFSFFKSNTNRFSRSFVPVVIRLRNDLLIHVEPMLLQKLKCGVIAFLLNRLFLGYSFFIHCNFHSSI